MKNKLAKLEYLPNNFKILEEGDHVICAVSGKKFTLIIWHTGMLNYRKLIFLIKRLF